MLAAVLLALVSCTLFGQRPKPSPDTTPTALPTPLTPAVNATVPPQVTITAPPAITLTWWTVESFLPGAGSSGGTVLADQVASFVDASASVASVHAVQKAAHGKGGVLDLMRAAQTVAPSILPDLVSLDALEMESAVRLGLLKPLDKLIPAELRNDLYPFAQMAGQVEETWYGIPYQADIQHLVYWADRLDMPPVTWQDVLNSHRVYLFPAGGRKGIASDATLIHYLSAGGEMATDGRGVVLSEGPLRAVLTFYASGRQAGVIPPTALDLRTTEATWPTFTARRADMVHVQASQYLAERTQMERVEHAAIPGADGRSVTIAKTWVLGIVTNDPARQAAAANLITWLLQPENSATWSQAAGYLPTRAAAMAVWDSEGAYASFLRTQLRVAVPYPSGPTYAATAKALQVGVNLVLRGAASPEEAAKRALSLEGQP